MVSGDGNGDGGLVAVVMVHALQRAGELQAPQGFAAGDSVRERAHQGVAASEVERL